MVFDLLAFLNDVTDNEENFNVIFKKMFPGPKFINPNAWYSHEDQKEEIKDPHSAARKEFNELCEFIECTEIQSQLLELQILLEKEFMHRSKGKGIRDYVLDETWREENPDDIEETERMLRIQQMNALKQFHDFLNNFGNSMTPIYEIFEKRAKLMEPVYKEMHSLIDNAHKDAEDALEKRFKELSVAAQDERRAPEAMKRLSEFNKARRHAEEKNNELRSFRDEIIDVIDHAPPTLPATVREMFKEEVDLQFKEQSTLNLMTVVDQHVPGSNKVKEFYDNKSQIFDQYSERIAEADICRQQGNKMLDTIVQQFEEYGQRAKKTGVKFDDTEMQKHLKALQALKKFTSQSESSMNYKISQMSTKQNIVEPEEHVRSIFKRS